MPLHEEEAVVCESRSFTQGTFLKLRHIWCIKHYSFYQDEVWLESATFCDAEHDTIKWKIILYPKSPAEEDNEFVAIYINLHSSAVGNVRALVKYSILDAEENPITERELLTPHEFYPGQSWGYPDLIRRNELLDHLKETSTDDLSVCVEVQALLNTVTSPSRILSPKTEEF